MSDKELKYGAEQIVSLSGYEHVRKRPGTYIGSTEIPNHLALEIIANSLDEAMNGFGDEITIEFSKGNTVLKVSDYGRGIVVNGKHEKHDCSTLEAAFSILNTGGKYDTAAFSASLGANGQGSKITNFLSTYMEVKSIRDGKSESIRFEKGIPVSTSLEDCSRRNGVIVEFSPDAEIFDTNVFDVKSFRSVIEQMSYLTKGVRYVLIEDGKETVYLSEHGLKDYMDKITGGKEIIKNQYYVNETDGKMSLEVSMTYTDTDSERLKIFANNGENPDGGTHITAFKTNLTRQLNAFANSNGLLKAGEANLSGSNYAEGLVIILNLKAPDIVYDGQTKTKVNSTDIRPFVNEVSNRTIKDWLEANPSDAKIIIEKALLSRRATEAAKRARDKVKAPGGKAKGLKEKLAIASKLRDASTKTPAKDREIFIVEGK